MPVIRKTYPKSLDEQRAIIEFNRYRIKTGQQLYNEGKLLKEIEADKAKQRQEATQLIGKGIQKKDVMAVENLPPPSDNKKTRDIIAKTIGLGSGKQWDKLVRR